MPNQNSNRMSKISYLFHVFNFIIFSKVFTVNIRAKGQHFYNSSDFTTFMKFVFYSVSIQKSN